MKRIAALLPVILLAAACQLRALNVEPTEITLTPWRTSDNSAAEATADLSNEENDLGIVAAAPPTDIVAVTPGRPSSAPTRPAPAGRCTATPNGSYDVNIREAPGAQHPIAGVLHYGDFADAYARTNSGWIEVDIPGTGAGWVSSSVVTLHGPCNLRIAGENGGNAASIASTPAPYTVGASPTSRFLGAGGGYIYVTLRQVGGIPANTQVSIGSAYFDGSGWVYQIGTREGKGAEARDADLAFAPGITPFAPTPPPAFDPSWGFSFITTEQVGSIPANTRIRLSTIMWDGYEWIYRITTDDLTFVDARESQIGHLPGVNPVGPTPTAGLDTYLRTGPAWLTTTEQIGPIPPNTRVYLSSARFNGYGWIYSIATDDGQLHEAYEYQLAPAPVASSTPVECRAMANTALGVVNIRSGPGASFGALNAFGPNDAVSVLGRVDNGWYLLRMYASGRPFEGFAPAGEIALFGDCNSLPLLPAANYQPTPVVQELPPDVSPGDVVIPEGMCTVIATTSSANIHERNHSDSPVIAVLRPGPWLTVNARDGKGWYRVTLLNGGLGWVSGSQVQVNGQGEACEALPML